MRVKKNKPLLQILLPVYNEAESIKRVIVEIYKEISPKISLQFIVSEDGSTDGTKEIGQENPDDSNFRQKTEGIFSSSH